MEHSTNRFEEINQLLLELASGNFDARRPISDAIDEWDSIIASINMLGEELRFTTISKDYLDSIYRGIVDMVIIISPDRNIQTVNKFVTEVLGYTEEEMSNNPITDYIANIQAETIQQLIKELNEKGYSYNTELDFITKGGRLITTSSSTSLIKDNNNNTTGVLIVAKDISKLKKTEQELLIKNKELDTLFYKTSHDLKSPITTILGISNLAEMETKDENMIRYLEMIKKCVQNLEGILDKIREIRELRLPDGSQATKENIDFKSLLLPLVKNLAHKNHVQEDEITLNIQSNQTTPYIGSVNLIKSILSNILDISLKSKKAHVKCLIACQIVETLDGYIISILDNGVGIPTPIKDKVFDMFVKTNQQNNTTGLELYAVRNIVNRLDGDVKLISEEGNGTEIQIFLPHSK